MVESAQQFWAVVPAAGKGRRMQQRLPKQYIPLNGKPIIEHSINSLLSSGMFAKVMVCIASDDEQWADLSIAANPDVDQVVGGATRAQSVLNGLNAISSAASDDWVLVHDAARPCLRATTVQKLVSDLKGDAVGGILAARSNDTLKQATTGALPTVEATLERSNIWKAQTPQMFRFGLLKDALSSALNKKLAITDEASAMENAGHVVRLVEGDPDNLKVTTEGDLALAEFLLER